MSLFIAFSTTKIVFIDVNEFYEMNWTSWWLFGPFILHEKPDLSQENKN
jgi:hypothetical protein